MKKLLLIPLLTLSVSSQISITSVIPTEIEIKGRGNFYGKTVLSNGDTLTKKSETDSTIKLSVTLPDKSTETLVIYAGNNTVATLNIYYNKRNKYLILRKE